MPRCVPDVRIEVSQAAWSKHWRQCVWLTRPTSTRPMRASCCCKRTARTLPRCGARAKSTYCDLSSFGPALFEIWWPDISFTGPYGPVKDKLYWPELIRRSEKCTGPVLMSWAAGSISVITTFLGWLCCWAQSVDLRDPWIGLCNLWILTSRRNPWIA